MLLTKHTSFGLTSEGKYDGISKANGFYLYTETADNIHIVRMSVEGWDTEEFNREFWAEKAPGKTITEDPEADIWTSTIDDESSFEIIVNGAEMSILVTDKEIEETKGSLNDFLKATGLSKEMIPSEDSLLMLVKLFYNLDGKTVVEIYKYFQYGND